MLVPRDAAIEVIQDYLVDDEGMLEVPIDPIILAEKMGLRVQISSTLGPGVSGVIVKEAGEAAPRIYLAAQDPPARQRFTAAHEIGHYMARKAKGDDAFGYVDERADLSSAGTDQDERWANKFAAELLMPAFVVRKFFGEGWRLSKLAKEFGVSEQAMGYRLQNLYLV